MLSSLVLTALLSAGIGGYMSFDDLIIRRSGAAPPGETFRYYVLADQVFTESSNGRAWVQNGKVFRETL